MKVLKTAIAIALASAGLGSAVVLGVSATNNEVSEAKATIWRENPTLYFLPSTNWAKDSATFKMTYYDNAAEKGTIAAVDTGKTYDSRKIYEFHVTDNSWVSAVKFLRMSSNGGTQWNNSSKFDISDNYDSGTNSLVMTAGSSVWSDWNTSSSGISWNTLSSITTTRTVTKMAVEFIDGVAQSPADWGLGSDVVIDGDTYPVPPSVDKNLEHFEGWFTNAACTTAYTARAISANTTIYAKYTKLTVDSYVYYITGVQSNPVFTHAHFFGDYTNNAEWPGTALSTYATEVHGVFSFEGTSQLIYKIPVPSSGSFSMVLNNGGSGKQTYDISVTPRAGYWCWLKDGETKYSYSANLDAGSAIDLLVKVENKRNAVSESGNIKQYSICGISSVDAASLYNEYLGLNTAAKGFVDSSSTYTYDYEDMPNETNVSFADIMIQLRAIAVAGHQTVNDSRTINSLSVNNSTSLTVITIVGVVSLSATGAFFLLRKKRKEQ